MPNITCSSPKPAVSTSGQFGRLQAVLFETFFTRFDFRERWPIEMPDADTFHFLAVIHTQLADWVAYPEFAASCLPISCTSRPTRYA